MLFTYAYKTRDGVRHEAEMEAPDRDSVFAELRRQGIRAIKVAPKNPAQTVDLTRRVVLRALVVAGVAAAVILAIGWHLGKRSRAGAAGPEPTAATDPAPAPAAPAPPAAKAPPPVRAKPLPRQYIRGDRTRLGQSAKPAFESRLDAGLALFAEPGRIPPDEAALALPDTLRETLAATNATDLLKEPIPVYATDLTEVTDLKRIVAGIKAEALEYLGAGGTFDGFVVELNRRQKTEASYRIRVDHRLESLLGRANGDPAKLDAAYQHWLRANAMLESLGIYTLPLPTQLQNYQQSLLDLDEDDLE